METVELLSHRLFRAKTSFLAEAASICAFAEDDPGRCKAPNVKNLSYYLQKAFFIFSKLRNNAAGVHPSGTLIFPIDDPIQGGGRRTRVSWRVQRNGRRNLVRWTFQNQSAARGRRDKDEKTHTRTAQKSYCQLRQQGQNTQTDEKPNGRHPHGRTPKQRERSWFYGTSEQRERGR